MTSQGCPWIYPSSKADSPHTYDLRASLFITRTAVGYGRMLENHLALNRFPRLNKITVVIHDTATPAGPPSTPSPPQKKLNLPKLNKPTVTIYDTATPAGSLSTPNPPQKKLNLLPKINKPASPSSNMTIGANHRKPPASALLLAHHALSPPES